MAEVIDDGQRLEPWHDPVFRADLEAYAEGEAENARRYARDARLLARMASQVPRVAWDTRGATAWTSFLGELAVARRSNTQRAAADVADAQQLVLLMPVTLSLLDRGELVVARARALLEAVRPCEDDLVRALDRDLAARACDLTPTRIRSEVDRRALQHGVDAAAARSAAASAGRGTRRAALPDGQAEFALVGPALALAQAQAAVDADARTWLAALRGSGDARGLDQLRFDLSVHRLLGGHAGPLPQSGGAGSGATAAASADAPAPPTSSGDLPGGLGRALPDPTSPSWWTDRRFSRPVRLDIAVPVTTALGLSDEPGWLPGYGWVSAPQVRQLLPVAELRQACVAADGPSAGQLVDLADRVVRPRSTPGDARASLLEMVAQPFAVTDKTWAEEPRHDPSPALAEFVRLRDRHCDGPVAGRPLRTTETDLDHDKPYDPRDDEAREHSRARPPGGQGYSSGGDRHPGGERHGGDRPDRDWPDRDWLDRDRDRDRPDRDQDDGDRAGCDRHDGDPRAVGSPRSWRVGGSPAWAAHGDTGFDLDPVTGMLTLVDLGHPDVQHLGRPAPDGPTAAWNLVGRGRRAHGLKHRGWTPLRTATGTLWFTPAGQRVQVLRDLVPVAPVAAGRRVDDAQALHEREATLLAPCAVLPPLGQVHEDPWKDAGSRGDTRALLEDAAHQPPLPPPF